MMSQIKTSIMSMMELCQFRYLFFIIIICRRFFLLFVLLHMHVWFKIIKKKIKFKIWGKIEFSGKIIFSGNTVMNVTASYFHF